jgi:hypothetical protein
VFLSPCVFNRWNSSRRELANGIYTLNFRLSVGPVSSASLINGKLKLILFKVFQFPVSIFKWFRFLFNTFRFNGSYPLYLIAIFDYPHPILIRRPHVSAISSVKIVSNLMRCFIISYGSITT